MTVGRPVTKAALDDQVADIAAQFRNILRAAQDLNGKVAAQTQDQVRALGYDPGVTGSTAGPEEYLLRLICQTMDDHRTAAEGGSPSLMSLITQVAG